MASNIFLAITITFMYAAPLILTALGGVVSERSGVINIGLEGMMVIGAFAGAAAGYYSASPWIGFLAAGLAGGLLALLHAVASITFKANQTISGVALNFIGQGLALFLCRLFFDGATMSKPAGPAAGGCPAQLRCGHHLCDRPGAHRCDLVRALPYQVGPASAGSG